MKNAEIGDGLVGSGSTVGLADHNLEVEQKEVSSLARNIFLPVKSALTSQTSSVESSLTSNKGQKGPAEVSTPAEVQVKLPSVAEQSQSLEARLKSAAEKNITNPEMQERFRKDLQTFQERMGNSEQYNKTLEQVDRLLEAREGKVTQEQRILAAQSILYNAAHPDTISQITCGAGALEHKLYTTQPSIPAEITATIALEGSCKGPDGKTISFPAEGLPPVDTQFPPGDAQCSYASQLFQIHAVNDIGQHLNPPMKFLPGETHVVRKPFEMRTVKGESWLLEDGTKVPFSSPRGGPFSLTGGLTSSEVAAEVFRLTGEKSGIITNRAYDLDDVLPAEVTPGINGDYLRDVRSVEALEQNLISLKQQGKLPVVVNVSAAVVNNLDGSTVSKAATPDHFVTVDDYVPAHDGQPAKVYVHNQHGSSRNGWMNLEHFFIATT